MNENQNVFHRDSRDKKLQTPVEYVTIITDLKNLSFIMEEADCNSFSPCNIRFLKGKRNLGVLPETTHELIEGGSADVLRAFLLKMNVPVSNTEKLEEIKKLPLKLCD